MAKIFMMVHPAEGTSVGQVINEFLAPVHVLHGPSGSLNSIGNGYLPRSGMHNLNMHTQELKESSHWFANL